MGKKHSQKYFRGSSILSGFCEEFLNTRMRMLNSHYKQIDLTQLMKLTKIFNKHMSF